MDAAPLLDPKNDAVFKRLFAGAPHLLAELINAVRSSEPPLTVVEILNPDITPEDLSGKQIILDILARDPEGKLYNVEMTTQRSSPPSPSICWTSRYSRTKIRASGVSNCATASSAMCASARSCSST